MRKATLFGLLAAVAIAYAAIPAGAARQTVTVKVAPAAAAVINSCSCQAWASNRRGSSPYGYHHFSWGSDAQTVTVRDNNGSVRSNARAGQSGGSYPYYGTITWSVTCESTNEVGDRTMKSCSASTILSCFPAGTQITMIDASGNLYYKNIEDVKVGETVLSWDPASQQFVPSVVTQPVKTTSNSLFEFTDAAGNSLKITPTHKMYIEGKGFIPSEDVRVGDILVTAPDGNKVPITSIEKIDGAIDVYNLLTDEPHDFFAQNILVHNQDDPSHKNHGFVAGTMIQTMRGPVPIEQVKVGDKLLAVDPATGLIKLNPVLRTGKQNVAKTIKINGLQMGTAQPLYMAKKPAKSNKKK